MQNTTKKAQDTIKGFAMYQQYVTQNTPQNPSVPPQNTKTETETNPSVLARKGLASRFKNS